MTEPNEESSAAPETTVSPKSRKFWSKFNGSLGEIWEEAIEHYEYWDIKHFLHNYPDLLDLFEEWYEEYNL